ncbi:MAG: helix-turn-helix transcriptional regulator [Bacilli bacterium]|jgi:transcriptional regulator with XRE-family HTH domain
MLSSVKVGNRIRTLREEKKLTQEELAGKVFVTRQAISSWEKGQSFPDIDNVVSLCEIFQVSLEDLLCLK